MRIDNPSTADGVETTLNYLIDTGTRPVTYTFAPPAGIPRTTARHESRRAVIHNLRPLADQISLDEAGFQFLAHESAVRNFWNEDELKQIYYSEAEALLRQATGAARVHIFDHTLRRRIPGLLEDEIGRISPRQPADRVHVDQTALSGFTRLRHMLPDEAEELLQYRCAIVNLWRPIRGPALDSPLAVCDARSVVAKDLIACDLLYPDRRGEIYSVAFNPEHRWFYVPAMQTNEVLLIKCFDSCDDGLVARFAPHTAFTDPTTPSDAEPRESLELRTYLFFGPDTRRHRPPFQNERNHDQ